MNFLSSPALNSNHSPAMGAGDVCLRFLNFIPLRNRYVLTRNQKLRIRYVTPFVILAFLFLSVSAQQITNISAQPKQMVIAQNQPSKQLENMQPSSGLALVNRFITPIMTESAAPTRTAALPAPLAEENKVKPEQVETNISKGEEVTLASFFKTNAPAVPEDNPLNIEIRSGQTVAGRLTEIGVPSSDAYSLVEALGKHVDPRKIRPGQSFEVEYDNAPSADGTVLKSVSKMTMPVSPAKEIIVYRQDESFKAKEIEKKLNTTIAANKATIKYSLYGSAAKANIPDEVIANMIKIFSFNVDFQRDIRSGDEIEILYETKSTDDGTLISYGDILYARLVTGGKDLSLYRHKTSSGHVNYFDPKGNSIKRTLMKTPIDGARMSSGFGMRRHPVLGYNKMHKGVDFAAPTGTPIYAAGDGVVEKAGRQGSYGNYVRIRHTSKLKTAYAHMHRIKSGLRAGSRVKQGQLIGTVGTTGRSTGPHLHYEVIMNGKQVNPRGVNVPVGQTLKGKELKRFKANRANFDRKFSKITNGEEYAQAGTF